MNTENKTIKKEEPYSAKVIRAITLASFGIKSDEIARVVGVTKNSASVYRSIYTAITEDDYSYFEDKNPDASVYNVKVGEVCDWMIANGRNVSVPEVWEKIRATQKGKKTATAKASEEQETVAESQDDLFYIKVLEGLACLPKILTAIENVSNKLTVLNQRIYDPINTIDGNVADLVDAHNTVLRKIDRIAKAVSKFEGDGSPTPTTVIDSIDEGFTDVCAKLDTVRFKLEKAIK